MIAAFLIKPFLALILITISCSLLGIFTLWKKFSYFGDGLSHSVLLGFALSAIFNFSESSALILFAILFAILVETISLNRLFSKSTVIAISSYFCIALAIILNDLSGKSFDLGTYIFGDVLTVENSDIVMLAAITTTAICYTTYAFRKILLSQVSGDLAKIDGIKVVFWNLSFTILLAVTIALSVRIVGIFLMTALLILPAAIARIFSNSAKQMALLSIAIGITVSISSFKIADNFDLTVSAVIITIFCLIFASSLALKSTIKLINRV